MSPLTRRQFIGATTGLVVAGSGLAVPAGAITINPRSSWADGLAPKGSLEPEDVRFLIVHHSASHNGHTAAQVPDILRGWYHFHTGPDKGWPDIAYNFIIDSSGGVWEGRKGSIDGPIAGSATGGNQGFTQLVCVIGDTNLQAPTAAAKTSLVSVLAWLAERYDVSTAPGAEVTFTSRGSNRWPAGSSVTTSTIAGHRDMSKTSCPGDRLYSYVTGSLSADVEFARGGSAPPPATTTTTLAASPTSPAPPTTSSTTTPPTSTTTTLPPTTTIAPTTTTVEPTTTFGRTTSTPAPPSTVASVATQVPTTIPVAPLAGGRLSSAAGAPTGLIATAAGLLLAGAGALAWRRGRMRDNSG